jgi:dienelactone hydrolase
VKTLAIENAETIHLQSLTLPPSLPLSTSRDATPVALSGELSLPLQSGDRVPAVILAHGCSGVGAVIRGWVKELNSNGIATLVLDSFAGRKIRETCTGQQRINLGSRIIDAYRALELLASHPRIDPARIALMGFSQGGGVVFLARHTRFHKLWMTEKRDFAAYLAFYPGCSRKLIDEEKVSDRPFQMFHGAADDWTPIQPCREYSERMRRLGKDVALFEYADAHHGFDNPNAPAARFRPQVLNGSNCVSIEQPDGRFRTFHRDSGRRSTRDDPCLRRGATIGYNPAAYRKAVQDVKDFLSRTFASRSG